MTNLLGGLKRLQFRKGLEHVPGGFAETEDPAAVRFRASDVLVQYCSSLMVS